VNAPPAPGRHTRCVSWPDGERRAAVRCYSSGGQAIQCCGHGLLCCAEHWLRHWGAPGTLQSCGTDLPCRRREGLTWIGFPTMALTPLAPPGWLTTVLPGLHAASVLRCASAGPDDGYLVVELAAGADLPALDAPGAALAAYTHRALILACGVDARSAQHDEALHYRYFAPQYGAAEDVATGSAMRVLASYWPASGAPLTALQRSRAGGYLHALRDGDTTWVGGRVAAQQQERRAHG